MVKAALWIRVSDPGQHADNQLPDLRALAHRRSLGIVQIYQLKESAWQGGHLKMLSQVYRDARQGKFSVLLVWALDRLSREGPLATLEIVHRLGQYGFYLAVQRFIPSERIQAALPVPQKYKSYVYQGIGIALMFNLTVLAWIPFRAEDLSTSMDMFRAILFFEGAGSWASQAKWLAVVGSLFGLHALERLVAENPSVSLKFWGYVPSVGKGIVYAGLIISVMAFSGTNPDFIYFRF